MKNHHHHPHNNPSHHNNQSGAIHIPAARTPLHETIACRAQELWVKLGRPENRDESIWLQAEAELVAVPIQG